MKSEEATESADLLGVFEGVFGATRATFAGGRISVWDYSDPTHFGSLWKSLEGDEVKTAGRVLIIWPKTPIDESLLPVNTVVHVSPLHWSACAAKKYPQIQVCILDLNPAAHRGQYLYEHYLNCDKGRLTWLRIIQAAHLFGVETANCRFQPDDAAVGIESASNRLFPQLESKRVSIEARHFLDRVRSELTSPQNAENRHAIANVIAPMLLNSEGSSSHHSKALHILLHNACDLPCGKIASPEECPGFDLGLLHIDPPEIVFIDDQAHHGWHAWLSQQSRRLFGVRKGQPVTPVSLLPPKSFLNQIEHSNLFPFGFRFKTSKTGQCPQIVLLDLRLFSGDSFDEELRFLSRIADICEQHLRSPSLDEDWHVRLRSDIGVVKEWLKEPQRETPAHHLALTLPARLVSLLDFSMPVVIFSSTGQTSILKHFALHPNIITEFEKPRFFAAEGCTLVADAENKLYRAIERALGFVLARGKCETLLRLHQPQSRCTNAITHIELYLDETGKRGDLDFAVGGCFAVFNHAGDALALADQFNDILFRNGVLYFHPVCFEPQGMVKAKKQPCDAEVLRGLRDAEQAGCCPMLGFVRIMANKQQPPLSDTGNLFDPNSADQRFVNALTALLEVFLFESLPLILGTQSLKSSPNVSVSVFVAPRAPQLGPAEASEAEYKFGYYRPSKNQIQSFSTDDVTQVIRLLLDSHSTSVNVERLVGIQLVYEKPGFGKPPRHAERFRKRSVKSVVHLKTRDDGQGFANVVVDARNSLCLSLGVSEADLATTVVPDYRALHYVADEVLSANNAQTIYSSIFSKSLPGQLDGDFHYSVRDVSRLLDTGQLAKALIALEIPPQHVPSGQVVSDSRQLAATRCARNLEHLSMQEFAQVAWHCQNTAITKSKVARLATYVDAVKKVVVAQNEPPTDYLQMGKEYLFLSGIKERHYFKNTLLERLNKICDTGVENVSLFQDYRGTRCAYVKCQSCDVARELANRIAEMSWGWGAQQCRDGVKQ